jgi:membrane protease YdiL (CAAX protease family)
MNNRIVRFIIFAFLVFYLPVILIWINIIPFEFRFHILVAMAVIMTIYSFAVKQSLHDLGFRIDTLKASLLWNGGLSAFFVVLMYSLYMAGLIREPTVPSWTLFYLFYVFISSPAQEFIYRSVMFAELERANIKQPFPRIAISAVTFCFLHVIYNDWITLAVALFMGVIWGFIYNKKPIFWGVTISHAILGVVSIATGLI